MNLSEWQLESEAAEQADEQTDRDLSHEHLAEEPHGEVHVVVLHGEVVPVEGHVEQVTAPLRHVNIEVACLDKPSKPRCRQASYEPGMRC